MTTWTSANGMTISCNCMLFAPVIDFHIDAIIGVVMFVLFDTASASAFILCSSFVPTPTRRCSWRTTNTTAATA
jgi:hypothetical protein